MTKKTKEEPAQGGTRAERIAQRMMERIRESDRLAMAFQSTLDPRQFQT